MLKKIIVPFILALVAAMVFSSVGYATNDRNKPIYHIKGSIYSVDAATMTLRIATAQGKHTVHLDAATIYRGRASQLRGSDPVDGGERARPAALGR
jgi:uncharacterized membrane protein